MFFVGHTRFSLYQPGSRAWAATTRHPDYRSYLFSEERLAPRAHIFFEHTLPLIHEAIRDHQVRHIVAHSAEMPDKYLDQMDAAAARYDWLVPDQHTDGIGRENIDRTARAMMDARSAHGVFGAYRVDDDDLLPVDYFDRMANYTTDANVGMYVSLGAGITAAQDGAVFRNPRHVVQRMFSAGILSVCRYGLDGKITRPAPFTGHNKADEAAPVIVDSREPGFYWNRNVTQDTTWSTTDGSPEAARSKIDKTLDGLPPVTAFEPIYAKFPTLRDKLKPQPTR